MGNCWNAFCIATDCNGVHHVDTTGSAWKQERGTEYDPATGDYVRPENMSQPSPVITLYERITAAHLTQQNTYDILTDSMLFGSEWFFYSAPCGTSANKAWTATVTDTKDYCRTATIGHGEIVKAMQNIADGKTKLADLYVKQVRAVIEAGSSAEAEEGLCQLDAISFDAIVQVAVLGDVVYG